MKLTFSRKKWISIITAAGTLMTAGFIIGIGGWFGGGGTIPDDTMTRGLVGYWSFDEGMGDTAYNAAATGSVNNGALGNGTVANMPSWSNGKINGALDFDGMNDYIDCGSDTSLNITDAITIEAWVKGDGWKGTQTIAGRSPIVYDLLMIDNTPYFYSNGDLLTKRAVGSSISSLQWHHITGVYDGTNTIIYVNGVRGTDASEPLAPPSSVENFYIGSRGGSTRYFNGTIDEVRIYNRALSTEEIRYHYNRGGPCAEYKFNEGTGTTAYDTTDNNNNGTWNGTGTHWATGKFGSAGQFADASGDYVSIANNISNARTISFWTNLDTTTESIISGDGTGITVSAGVMSYGAWDNCFVDGVDTDTITTNWHYVVLTSTSDVSLTSIKLGYTDGGLDGKLDDVKIYAYERTAGEIRLDYNAGFAARFGDGTSYAAMMNNGLVGYWSMDEGGGSIINDYSSNSNDGTISGASWTSGKKGGALEFDGVDDYVGIGDLGIGNEYTAECWIKTDRIDCTGFNCGIMASSASAEQGYPLWFSIQGTEIYFHAYQSSSDGHLTSGANINTTNWFHIVATAIYGSTSKVYVNGVEKLSFDNVGTNPWTSVFTIGDLRSNRALCFDGTIDEVRIYNRVLGADEIRYHYNRGRPVGHWRFDEGSGTTAFDESWNNNDGTITPGSGGWVQGQYGTAYDFDGSATYVNCGNIGTGIKTVEFWLNTSQTDDGILELIDNDTYISVASSAITATNFTSPTIYVNGIETSSLFSGWNHIAVTTDTGISAASTKIGEANSDYTTGAIDEIRIYDYARSADEIRADYNEGFVARFGDGTGHAAMIDYGLNGYWNFEGNVDDISDGGHNGTVTGSETYTSGKYGTGFSFDGSTNVLAGNVGSVKTTEFWIKDSNADDGILELINNTQYISIASNDIDLTAGFTNSTTYVNGATGSTLSASKWNHVVVVADAIASASFNMGEANSDYMAGILDDVRIYNRALGTEEIRYHYNRGRPVGHWRFNEGNGTTAFDESWNNNDGTITPGSGGWVQGQYGTAYDFDGSATYVNCGNDSSLDITDSITIEAWVKLNALGAWQHIAGKQGMWRINGYGFRVTIDNKLQFVTLSSFYDVNSITALTTGVWYHVAAVQSGTSYKKIYLNGVEDGIKTNPGAIVSALSANLQIGRAPIWGTEHFNGTIDEVRIYNYARSAAQILQDYNAGLGTHFE